MLNTCCGFFFLSRELFPLRDTQRPPPDTAEIIRGAHNERLRKGRDDAREHQNKGGVHALLKKCSKEASLCTRVGGASSSVMFRA